MRPRFQIISLATALSACVLCADVRSQTNDSAVSCSSKAECTAIIEDVKQGPKARASAHASRAYKEDNYDRAIADIDTAIRLDPAAYSLAERAGMRARFGRDLDEALAEANKGLEAIRAAGGSDAAPLHWRAVVELRLGRFDDAIADFNAANDSWGMTLFSAIYGRGLAKLMKGDAVGGNADIARVVDEAKNSTLDGESARDAIADFAAMGLSPSALPAAPSQAASAPTANSAGAPSDCNDAELHWNWKSAEAVGTVAAFQDHLARFPSCAFADLAKMKIEAMKK